MKQPNLKEEKILDIAVGNYIHEVVTLNRQNAGYNGFLKDVFLKVPIGDKGEYRYYPFFYKLLNAVEVVSNIVQNSDINRHYHIDDDVKNRLCVFGRYVVLRYERKKGCIYVKTDSTLKGSDFNNVSVDYNAVYEGEPYGGAYVTDKAHVVYRTMLYLIQLLYKGQSFKIMFNGIFGMLQMPSELNFDLAFVLTLNSPISEIDFSAIGDPVMYRVGDKDFQPINNNTVVLSWYLFLEMLKYGHISKI